jgi:hypothetical protein
VTPFRKIEVLWHVHTLGSDDDPGSEHAGLEMKRSDGIQWKVLRSSTPRISVIGAESKECSPYHLVHTSMQASHLSDRNLRNDAFRNVGIDVEGGFWSLRNSVHWGKMRESRCNACTR